MQDFHECPHCRDDLEQWSLRFHRSDLERVDEQALPAGHTPGAEGFGRAYDRSTATTGAAGDGLTLLSLCPNERCGYYVLRYRNGLSHWDRDIESARLLRTVFGGE